MWYRFFLLSACIFCCLKAGCWGFYAHKEINYHAVFLLPPALVGFYKPNIDFIKEHAVNPDKRRYIVPDEAPRHFIDLDYYGSFPFPDLPRSWQNAVAKYGEATLQAHGIVPWWIQVVLNRLTVAMRTHNHSAVLKLSADLGHYIADAHVPLHAHSNYNGQKTNQHGIHGLWESRIPELVAATRFNYFIGKAIYIEDPLQFMWERILESAAAADTVLQKEQELSEKFGQNKHSYEYRNGFIIRQYSEAFTLAYHESMQGMVENRMRQSIQAVASFWYTAWINAGQPALATEKISFSEDDQAAFTTLDKDWQSNNPAGRSCGN